MAIGARQAAVATVQREARGRMVEVNILPIAGVMTIRAVPAHLPSMRVLMTGNAVHGSTLEQEILMAACADNANMFTCQ